MPLEGVLRVFRQLIINTVDKRLGIVIPTFETPPPPPSIRYSCLSIRYRYLYLSDITCLAMHVVFETVILWVINYLFLSNLDLGNCIPNPCLNGGTCTEKSNGYFCTCEENFKGQNCQKQKGNRKYLHIFGFKNNDSRNITKLECKTVHVILKHLCIMWMQFEYGLSASCT